jgi:nicotinate phosphoribosyltransferase
MNSLASHSIWPERDGLGTITDLYQLTMMAGYAASGLSDHRAVFELFVRRLPDHRSYLIFAGLEQAVHDLLELRINRAQADQLRTLPVFQNIASEWFDTLPDFRFKGSLWSVPEGTVVFAGEPLIRVEGTLPEAQWIETYLLASLAYPTLVASKASRIVMAAQDRTLFDFGTRRADTPLAGLTAARAAYIAGFQGTSNVAASQRWNIPVTGTMAHSWVQAFGNDADAFAAFAKIYPKPTLLVDTFDVLEGIHAASAIDPPVGAVRIDSGDLRDSSIKGRAILDGANRPDVKIVASGDLDEYKIAELIQGGAKIDGFGVGTELVNAHDAGAISMVYKLVEINGEGRVKRSPGKLSYPFAKQVFRQFDSDGIMIRDQAVRTNERAEGVPMLQPIIENGRLVGDYPSLDSVRACCRTQVASLPRELRPIDSQARYPVEFSPALENAARTMANPRGSD